MVAEENFKAGKVLWIDFSVEPYVEYLIHFIFSHPPRAIELCHHCDSGQLEKLGTLVQHGFFGDKQHDAYICRACRSGTVFVYWTDTVDPPSFE